MPDDLMVKIVKDVLKKMDMSGYEMFILPKVRDIDPAKKEELLKMIYEKLKKKYG